MNRALEITAAVGSVALTGFGLLPFLHREPQVDSWFQLQWPRELDEDSVLAMLRHLSALRRPPVVVFEAEGRGRRVHHRIGVPKADTARTTHVIAAYLPDVLLEPVERRSAELHHGVELRLGTRERALRTAGAEEIGRAVSAGLTSAAEGTIVQLVIGPRLKAHYVPASTQGLPSNAQLLKRAVSGNPPIDARSRTALQDKMGDHGFRAVMRIGTSIPDPKPAKSALRAVIGGLRVAEAPGVHLRVRRIRESDLSTAAVPRHWSLALNVGELVGLLVWPIGDAEYPGIRRMGSRRLPVPQAAAWKGRVIGRGNHPGTLRPVAQSASDALTHTWCIGPTGVGKSTLLARLALDDIRAGRGVVVIEPKGDLVADILGRIPKEREQDVVVIDPTDDTAVVGVNPLVGGPPELVSDQVLAVFRGLYGDYLGPRTTDVLAAALLTIARSASPTLVALPLLLSDQRFRRNLTIGLHGDIALGPFWAWFESLSDAERNQVVAPVMNKVRPFLLRQSVRRVLGQVTPRFDISSVFTERKILLVPLSSGQMGDATSLIGSLLVARLWQAVQGRSRIDPKRRYPVSVLVDEFQTFLHLPTDLADVLAQARGLGLGLTLAHQHLAQLTPDVRAAVLANARSKVCFRLSAEDATIVAKSTHQLEARDFQSLGRYEVYASLMSGGESQPFCSATTDPLDRPITTPARVRALSREQYASTVENVDAELRALWQSAAAEDRGGAIGQRTRKPRGADGGGS